jgi:hypothetical protein
MAALTTNGSLTTPTAVATAKKMRKNSTSRGMVSSSTVTSLAETLDHAKSTFS